MHVLSRIKQKSSKKLVIIVNEKDVRAAIAPELLGPCKGIISMVRIAIDPKNLGRSIQLAEAIKKMGFEVGFNVMYMSKWKEDVKFLEDLRLVDGLRCNGVRSC